MMDEYDAAPQDFRDLWSLEGLMSFAAYLSERKEKLSADLAAKNVIVIDQRIAKALKAVASAFLIMFLGDNERFVFFVRELESAERVAWAYHRFRTACEY